MHLTLQGKLKEGRGGGGSRGVHPAAYKKLQGFAKAAIQCFLAAIACLLSVIPATTGLSQITLPTTPPKPKCFGQSLNLPISQEKFQDQKLLGHVIWKQFALSELQCEDLCLRVPGCLAYNYHYSAEKEQKTCELMNEVVDIKNTPGYCFRLFERQRALSVSNS